MSLVVVAFIPVYKLTEAGLNIGGWLVANELLRKVDIGAGFKNVTGLHADHFLVGLYAEKILKRRDKMAELFGRVVTQV